MIVKSRSIYLNVLFSNFGASTASKVNEKISKTHYFVVVAAPYK